MPTKSPYPKLDLPDVDIWSFLFDRPNRPFADDHVMYSDPYTSRSYTFAGTRDTALSFALGLRSIYSLKKSDVVLLFTPNSIDTPSITWGTLWAGGIISPANPTYSASELAFQIKDSRARIILTTWELFATAKDAAKQADFAMPDENIVLLGDKRDPSGRIKHFTSIRNTSGATKYRKTKIRPRDDLAFLVYSSGTTGLPKGVMLSHRNIVANILQIDAVEGRHMTPRDKILAFLPFFHIYGLTAILHQSFFRGYQVIVMPRFDMQDFCTFVQDLKITYAYVAPPVVLGLSKHPLVDRYDLSSLRMMNSGAAPLTRDLVEALYARKKLKVKQGYGLSETSPTTHTQAWDDWHAHVGSVGLLLPNMTAKYMADDETEVEPGQVGELWMAGPNVFRGYLNNPQGTANALTADGYFKTGDVGYQDEEGNFYITDRVKELIKYKGFQVAPAELEGYLAAHDKVDDVAVIGVYSKDIASEVPRAYVVPKSGYEPSAELATEIADFIAGRVAHHKKLRGGVRFVDEIPKSASGKILRRVLKSRALDEDGLADDETKVKAKL